MNIDWNGFLKIAVNEYPKEACAFLYSSKPYSSSEKWYAYPLKNIAEDPFVCWMPDRKDVMKAKKWADKMKLVKIGNVHSHPVKGNWHEDHFLPSAIDLKFAKRFNDVIRGIVCIGKDMIYGIAFHDKYGQKINFTVVG